MEPYLNPYIKYVVTHIKQPALKTVISFHAGCTEFENQQSKEVISVKTISQLLAIVFLSFTVLTGASLPTDPVKEASDSNVKTFTVDYLHSNVGFKVRHLGISNVNGAFNEYEATVSVDPEDLSTLKAEATFQVGSIETGNDRRNGHLKSDDFFNAEMYPTITFKSNKVMVGEDGAFMLHGNLTIRDVTKEVVLEGEMLGTGMGQNGMKVGIEASTNHQPLRL